MREDFQEGPTRAASLSRLSASILLVALGLSLQPARAQAPEDAPSLRLVGLERFHFEPFDPESVDGHCGRELALLLARRLPEAGQELPESDEEFPCIDLATSRTTLPVGGPLAGSRVVISQVVSGLEQRIQDLHWCLYVDGGRADCWSYSPRTIPGKALTNLSLQGARATDRGIALDLGGQMFRPQGAFWMNRLDLHLDLEQAGDLHQLRPSFYVRRFLLGRGYERFEGAGDDFEVVVPAHYARTEALVTRAGSRRVVERRLDEVAPEDLERCGEADPESSLPTGLDDIEAIVVCLTASDAATVRERPLDQPTFLERDWRPPATDDPPE